MYRLVKLLNSIVSEGLNVPWICRHQENECEQGTRRTREKEGDALEEDITVSQNKGVNCACLRFADGSEAKQAHHFRNKTPVLVFASPHLHWLGPSVCAVTVGRHYTGTRVERTPRTVSCFSHRSHRLISDSNPNNRILI